MEFGRHPSLDNLLQGAKRQKITVACDPCRARKVRCDGNRPSCRQCMRARKKVPCTYDRQLPETQQKYVQELESRHAQSSSVERLQSVIQSVETAPPTGRLAEASGASAVSAGPSRSNPTLDEPQEVVSGESSSTTLLHQLSRLPEQPRRIFISDAKEKVPMKLGGSTEKAGVLPRRRVADDIIAQYWQFVHPLFPIIHEPTFMTAYEKSWISQPNSGTIVDEQRREFQEALFFSTLNIIFALGTRFCSSVSATEKSDMSREFYNRSRQTFPFDVLDCTSLPVLQMVLLQGIYLQSTTEISRCWNVIGVATRMAQSLGLHLDQTYQRQKTVYAREMGKRLWHSCLVLDRLAAATFGWPMMICGEHSIPLPVLGDDALNPQSVETSTSMKVFPGVNVFTHTCELFDIIGDILSTLYCNNGALMPPVTDQFQNARTLAQIMALNGRMEAYLITLPDFLHTFIEGSEQTRSIDISGPVLTIQQAISCRYRFHYMPVPLQRSTKMC
ncbi:hypothetical protein E4T44_06466 [Aureobasidium sp. EXF-8845]|nr:hypothetical protein E4T44_06466 [Aureobasidium sp. EXF-8845]KAI4846447.1 hypothetical protein E4T45_07244 [Aureobasidium sp. EXF-8846]